MFVPVRTVVGIAASDLDKSSAFDVTKKKILGLTVLGHQRVGN